MGRRRIDLHSHSRASDGSDSPAELVQKAAAKGLSALALTDHDTLSGLDEAKAEAEKSGLYLVRGIEIAVQDDFGELHILGLWMPQPSELMQEALDSFTLNRRTRNQAMLDVLTSKGMPLSMDEVRSFSGGGAVGRPHIARAMTAKAYVSCPKEAFQLYIGWGKEAFVPRKLMSPQEGISLLRNEGATVSLAHPLVLNPMTEKRLNKLLPELKSYGLDAIEAYHSSHSPVQTRCCVRLAAKHKLLLTGGSDYHGVNKEGLNLGTGAGSLRIPHTLLEKLIEDRREKSLWI